MTERLPKDLSTHTKKTQESLKMDAINHILRYYCFWSSDYSIQCSFILVMDPLHNWAYHLFVRFRFKVLTGKYEGICSLSCFAHRVTSSKFVFKTSYSCYIAKHWPFPSEKLNQQSSAMKQGQKDLKTDAYFWHYVQNKTMNKFLHISQ